MLIEIKSDALFVGERLKEIDQSYYVVFNTIKNRYEIHSTNQVGCSYCLSCPHPALDERLVELARKTRRDNINKLIEEIDKQNEILKQKEIKQMIEAMEENNEISG